MSDIDRTRMIPLHIADQAVAACDAEIAKLREENKRLKAAGDTLVAAYCMGDRNKERWAEYPVVREWLAAKGELP
jgi:hypothetical protein